jgi:hypothetical protein
VRIALLLRHTPAILQTLEAHWQQPESLTCLQSRYGRLQLRRNLTVQAGEGIDSLTAALVQEMLALAVFAWQHTESRGWADNNSTVVVDVGVAGVDCASDIFLHGGDEEPTIFSAPRECIYLSTLHK